MSATIMAFNTGSLSTGPYATCLAKDVSVGSPVAVSGVPLSNQPCLLACAYHVTAGAGVTAGVITFQELGGDGTWRNLGTPAPISMTAPGEFNGNFNGPFHGLRVQLSGLVGGTVSFVELQCALLT